MDSIAIKSSNGKTMYKSTDTVVVNGQKLGALLTDHDKSIKSLEASITNLKTLLGDITQKGAEMVKIKETCSHMLKEINTAVKSVHDNEATIKKLRQTTLYNSFRLDLLTGMLSEKIKNEFVANNNGGTRLCQIETWYRLQGTDASEPTPPEIEMYKEVYRG